MAVADASQQILLTFELFPYLPSEIRHEIWELSFSFFSSAAQLRNTDYNPQNRTRHRKPWN
jgi:hypothetical protein